MGGRKATEEYHNKSPRPGGEYTGTKQHETGSNPTIQQSTKTTYQQPLEIPSRKWAHVTTDLVIDLPESNGYTAITVFVDKLTKWVHLAYCTKEVTTMEYAKLFVDHVF